MANKGLEHLVNTEDANLKEKKKEFDIAHWLGVIGSYVGSAGLAYLTNLSTSRPYLSAALGSSVGDYLGYEAGFTPYWYLKNTDRYKGLKGKVKFAKDWTSFTVKSLPVELATYALSVPAAIAGTYLTGSPVLGTVLSGAALDIAHWLGLRTINRGKLKEIAAEKLGYNNFKPAYAH